MKKLSEADIDDLLFRIIVTRLNEQCDYINKSPRKLRTELFWCVDRVEAKLWSKLLEYDYLKKRNSKT